MVRRREEILNFGEVVDEEIVEEEEEEKEELVERGV